MVYIRRLDPAENPPETFDKGDAKCSVAVPSSGQPEGCASAGMAYEEPAPSTGNARTLSHQRRYDDLVDDSDDVLLRHLRSLEQEVVAKHRRANLQPSGRHRVSTDIAALDSSVRDLLHRVMAKLV